MIPLFYRVLYAISTLSLDAPRKVCSCGRCYGAANFRTLEIEGVDTRSISTVETRRCVCGDLVTLERVSGCRCGRCVTWEISEDGEDYLIERHCAFSRAAPPELPGRFVMRPARGVT